MDTNGGMTRNRRILERRKGGETLASLAAAYGISSGRVHQIAIEEQRIVERSLELQEADRLPQQPNVFHLSRRLRHTLQDHFGRENVTPLDILEAGFRSSEMFKIKNLGRRDWLELVQWMERAGFSSDT